MQSNTFESKRPALIGVDWGSTNFRAYLLSDRGEVIDQVSAAQGMLSLKPQQFEGVLIKHISPWVEQEPLPVLMAGMMGSRQGWCEAPYLECPANLAGIAANLTTVPTNLGLTICIVPGLKGSSLFGQVDVMRGEEVQIFGALAQLEEESSESRRQVSGDKVLMCLPGTHSKWARIESDSLKEARVVDFATQMTGELYSLLKKHSILGRSTEVAANEVSEDLEAFKRGASSVQGNGGLPHHLFSARSNVLAQTLKPESVDSYLSGMLVGSEVKEMLLALEATDSVVIVGSNVLSQSYQRALEYTNIKARCIDGQQAFCKGLYILAREAKVIT